MKVTAAIQLLASLGMSLAGCGVASEAQDANVVSVESQDVRVHRMKLLQYLSAYSLHESSNLNGTGPGWQMNIDSCELVPEGMYGDAHFDCTEELEAMVAAEWQTATPIPLAHQLIYVAQQEETTGRYFAGLACNLMEIDVVVDSDGLEQSDGVGFYFRGSSLGERSAGRFIAPEELYVAEPIATDDAATTTLRFLAVSSCYTAGSGAGIHSTAELKPFLRIGDTEHWETRPLNHRFPTPEARAGFEVYP